MVRRRVSFFAKSRRGRRVKVSFYARRPRRRSSKRSTIRR